MIQLQIASAACISWSRQLHRQIFALAWAGFIRPCDSEAASALEAAECEFHWADADVHSNMGEDMMQELLLS